MNSKQFYTLLILAGLTTICISCSHDREQENTIACSSTNVSMVINGELQTFQAIGRGIDLTADGYLLSLNLDKRSVESTNERAISIQLPYKQTGANLIQKFDYHQYIDNIPFDGEFVSDGNFQSDVLVNRETCFYATFSGTLNDGNQEVAIINGIISYTYETPFAN